MQERTLTRRNDVPVRQLETKKEEKRGKKQPLDRKDVITVGNFVENERHLPLDPKFFRDEKRRDG